MSLLSKAQSIPSRRTTVSKKAPGGKELEELAVAWLKGDVQYFQIAKILKTTGSSVYSIVFNALRWAIREKRITLIYKKK